MRSSIRHYLFAFTVASLATGCANCLLADDPTDLDFFEKKIRPVLVQHCYKCHASDAKKIRGGLLLDSREAIRKGGESGPSVVPHQPEESLLLEAIRYESFEMPPSGRLPDQVIAEFEHWIEHGAVDPRDGDVAVTRAPTIDIEQGKQFWSFQPLRQADPPSVHDRSWPDSDIDRFLLARLEAEGIQPVTDANRSTLIRRVYYALVGLPPDSEDIAAFTSDQSPTSIALSKLVDRLLESKHFGERWGRHWLDVVRFAESSGGGRTLLFPNAWRYRDYVIEALNRDMPYDQFLREQIAGDLLTTDDWQARRRQLIATSFLVLGPTNYELQDKDTLEMDIVDEQIDTIGKAFLGMTIGCARCHDHKFDPIPTSDYYAMAGILKSTKSVIHSNVSAWNTVNLPVAPELEAEFERHEALLAKLNKQLKKAKNELKRVGGEDSNSVDPRSLLGVVVDDTQAEKSGDWKNSTSVKGYVGQGYIHDNGIRDALRQITYTPTLPAAGDYELRVSYTSGSNRSTRVPIKVIHADGESVVDINQTTRAPMDGSFESLGHFRFEAGSAQVIITNTEADSGVVIADAVQFIPKDSGGKQATAKSDKLTAAQKSLRKSITERVSRLEAEIKKVTQSGPKRPVAMATVDEENASDIHLAIRGVVHNRGQLVPRGILQVAATGEFPAIPEKTSGRLQLADWIADAANPLTARMIVNRVWYWLFGEGLVRSVDNFGATGEPPSHPELLDHLAQEFMHDGWSIKRLIRRIMLSRVYRLSSENDLANAELDPSNRLLWRMNRRRLDAESIRDSLLHVAGTLDLQMAGSNIKTGTKIEYDYQFDSTRRSVYTPVFRNTLPPIFATFDFADPNIQAGKRTTSTIAPQALLLMNHPFVIEQSMHAAERLLADTKIHPEARIRHCYRQVLGRNPTPREWDLALQFVATDDEAQRWSLLYQTLFQSIGFRYVE